MEQQGQVRYFLGANTARGFYSLYDELSEPRLAEHIWYIKGGPGNGKSTFMRSIARAAEETGQTAEYICCSGDPDSLDGVLLRETHTVYVDATSPHVQEPRLPGAVGRYLDLSTFYKKNARYDMEAICERFRLCREQYERAYALLQAEALCLSSHIPGIVEERDREAARAMARELTSSLPAAADGRERRLFLSARTCKGTLLFPEMLLGCGRIVLVHSAVGLDTVLLREIMSLGRACGLERIVCPDPLTPEEPEGVLFPEEGLAFYRHRSGMKLPGAEHIYPDRCMDEERRKAFAAERQKSACVCTALARMSALSLEKAKQYHDELEALYSTKVDFPALNKFTQRHIKEYIK